MLGYIMGRIQEFERRHGVTPNVVYLNHGHYAALRQSHPELFGKRPRVSLGFHIILLSDQDLAHPRAGWIPPRVQTGPDADQPCGEQRQAAR